MKSHLQIIELKVEKKVEIYRQYTHYSKRVSFDGDGDVDGYDEGESFQM